MKSHLQFLTNIRSFGAFAHDVAIAYIAWQLSFLLRFNFQVPSQFHIHLDETVFLVLLVQAVAFIGFGLYQGIWRFASIPDLTRIIKAIFVAALTVASILLMVNLKVVVPRTVLILDPILLILLMGGESFRLQKFKRVSAIWSNS